MKYFYTQEGNKWALYDNTTKFICFVNSEEDAKALIDDWNKFHV